MRGKLTLNLEDLAVDTFDTAAPQKVRGTVFGEQCTCWTYCGQNTCPGCPTCDASCNGTCDYTCAYTCAYTCDDASCANNCGTNNTCGWGYTCGDCTALMTNCDQICL